MSGLILGRRSGLVVRRADSRAPLHGACGEALAEVARRNPAGVLAYLDVAHWLPCADEDDALRLRARGYEVATVLVEAAP